MVDQPGEKKTAAALADELNQAVAGLSFEFVDEKPQRLTVAGRTFCFSTTDAGQMAWLRSKHANGRIHEPATVAAFVDLLTHYKITTVFDVGALFGYFSLMSAALKTDCKVVTFEMNPLSWRVVKENIATNGLEGRVDARNLGVSDRNDRVPASIHGFSLTEGEGDLELEVVALDDLDIQPDLIKIDVEGYQAKIIPGAMKMLAKKKPLIIIELDYPDALARFGVTNAQILQPLLDMGYYGAWCGRQRTTGSRFVPLTEFGPRHEINSLLVLAHPDGPARI